MVDKELKDWCKNCDVEPPAMRFKCPECEPNPDKEQIIIDGVDVSECKHYEYKSLKDCEMRYPESGDCEIGLLNYLFNGNLDIEKFCKDNPNCYFKQLARKTQLSIKQSKELIRLRKELQESTVKNRNLKQECEELENKIKKLRKNLALEIEINYRYRKALEEIEEFCITYSDNHDAYETVYKYILDIINKAKEEE